MPKAAPRKPATPPQAPQPAPQSAPPSSSAAVGQQTRRYRHAELAISPLNVRYNEEDCEAVEALAAAIVREGQLQQIVLHTAPAGAAWAVNAAGEPAQFGVWAGGRRYRAIGMAIADGRLPADFPILAELRDQSDGLIVLDSLGENILRRELRPYEVHHAIARAVELGETIASIADRIGQAPDWVRRQLRLGELDPEIFAAYAAGVIDGDQAQAFAATADAELQRAAWAHFRDLPGWASTAPKIRAFYKIGDHQLHKLLLFVGEAIYLGAGGGFERDLFAAPDQGRVTDLPLLHRLVMEKRAVLQNRLREQLGERDLRFEGERPQKDGYTDQSLAVNGWKPADGLPKGVDPEAVVAVIEIECDGDWSASLWWASRSARAQALKQQSGSADKASLKAAGSAIEPRSGEALDSPDSTYGQRAREIVRDEHGLTADGLQIVRSLRRQILRAMLYLASGHDGSTLARDYVTWSQLRLALGPTRMGERSAVGARGLASEDYAAVRDGEPREVVAPYLHDSPAGALWQVALDEITGSDWMQEADPVASLTLFLDGPASDRQDAEAVLAGLSLLRSANTPGWRVAVHDLLAQRAAAAPGAAPLRALWRPTVAFAGLFAKLQRLALAQPFVDPEAFSSWHRQKDKPLAAAVAAALNGDCGGTQADAARRWVHPLLDFGLPVIPPEEEEGDRAALPSSRASVGQEKAAAA